MNPTNTVPTPINWSNTIPAATTGLVNVTFQTDTNNPRNRSASVAGLAINGTLTGTTTSNNFNSSTPAIPSGKYGVTFQNSVGNISAYVDLGGTGVTGSGTPNKLAAFTGTNAIGNSDIADDGTNIYANPAGGGSNSAFYVGFFSPVTDWVISPTQRLAVLSNGVVGGIYAITAATNGRWISMSAGNSLNTIQSGYNGAGAINPIALQTGFGNSATLDVVGNWTISSGSVKVSTAGQGIALGGTTEALVGVPSSHAIVGYTNNVASFQFDHTTTTGYTNFWCFNAGTLTQVQSISLSGHVLLGFS